MCNQVKVLFSFIGFIAQISVFMEKVLKVVEQRFNRKKEIILISQGASCFGKGEEIEVETTQDF